MKIDRALLDRAVEQGLLRPGQVEPLWNFLAGQADERPSFQVTHILYYLGGLIAIGALSLFVTLGWERFGGWGLFAIAATCALGGVWATEGLLRRRHLRIPAGIGATFAVAVVPLAIYGLQVALGFWGEGRAYRDYHVYVDWRWLLMELGTLAAGIVMLWRYRLPFLVMPVAFVLWYMSMDLAPFVAGPEGMTWALRKTVSLWFGLAMTLVAIGVDVRDTSGRDYAFWLYLFGVLAFWAGLSLLDARDELDRVGYLCINLGMIVAGAILGRRVFVVLGGLGVAGYLGHLAWTVFRDSLAFPFVLAAIGLLVVWAGIAWQRHEDRITAGLHARLPPALQRFLAQRR